MKDFNVTTNVIDVMKGLDYSLARQVPFAASLALNRTAKAVVQAEQHEMRDVFDRPKPITIDSLYIKPAKPQSLIAEVGLKNFMGKGNAASQYLAAEIQGGSRRMKRFEKALQAVNVLPEGYRAVPGSAAKMDAFGNMQPGQIVQILSFFKAFPEAGYKANMIDKRRASLARGTRKRQGYAYFVGRPADGNLPLGIWQRFQFAQGSAIKPVMIFVPSAIYEAIFDFDYVARITVAKEFDRHFQAALAEAARSAR